MQSKEDVAKIHRILANKHRDQPLVSDKSEDALIKTVTLQLSDPTNSVNYEVKLQIKIDENGLQQELGAVGPIQVVQSDEGTSANIKCCDFKLVDTQQQEINSHPKQTEPVKEKLKVNINLG